MKTMLRYQVALIAALTAAGPAALEATEVEPSPDAPPEAVRVVNNYGAWVNVYVEDADGRRHRLGRVAAGRLEEFEIAPEIAEETFLIRIYPAHPVWSLQQDDVGVKTKPIDFDLITALTIWLEPDLTKSVVESSQD